jgi:hypothetical protein
MLETTGQEMTFLFKTKGEQATVTSLSKKEKIIFLQVSSLLDYHGHLVIETDWLFIRKKPHRMRSAQDLAKQ